MSPTVEDLTDGASRNGATDVVALAPSPPPMPPAPEGPREPRLEDWVDIVNCPGLKARLWLNPPHSVRMDLKAEDGAKVQAALRRVVLEHNGWCDTDGSAYPPADDPDFWDALSQPLAVATIVTAWQEVGKPRNFPRPTPRG